MGVTERKLCPGDAKFPPNLTPVLYPKNRIISVRVSEQEYDVLRDVTRASGLQSVSDYMRSRLFEPGEEPPAGGPSMEALARLTAEIESLRGRFDRLRQHVGLEEDC